MVTTKMLRVRLTNWEWQTLQKYAESKHYSMSEVIRDYIKTLPSIHPVAGREGRIEEER